MSSRTNVPAHRIRFKEAKAEPKHFVRSVDDSDDPRPEAASTLRRVTARVSNFLFNKRPDRTPPENYPNRGFNANANRHS